MKNFLIALIREAIHAELSERLSESEAKLSRIESNFANIAVRVKEKQEQDAQDKPRLKRERTQQEARERAIISRLEGIEGRLDAALAKSSERETELTAKLLEAKKPQRPRTWSEAKERLEAESNG